MFELGGKSFVNILIAGKWGRYCGPSVRGGVVHVIFSTPGCVALKCNKVNRSSISPILTVPSLSISHVLQFISRLLFSELKGEPQPACRSNKRSSHQVGNLAIVS